MIVIGKILVFGRYGALVYVMNVMNSDEWGLACERPPDSRLLRLSSVSSRLRRVTAINPVNPTLYLEPASSGFTDCGTNWTLTPLTAPVVNAIAVDPINPVRLYAGTKLNPVDTFVAKIVE